MTEATGGAHIMHWGVIVDATLFVAFAALAGALAGLCVQRQSRVPVTQYVPTGDVFASANRTLYVVGEFQPFWPLFASLLVSACIYLARMLSALMADNKVHVVVGTLAKNLHAKNQDDAFKARLVVAEMCLCAPLDAVHVVVAVGITEVFSLPVTAGLLLFATWTTLRGMPKDAFKWDAPVAALLLVCFFDGALATTFFKDVGVYSAKTHVIVWTHFASWLLLAAIVTWQWSTKKHDRGPHEFLWGIKEHQAVETVSGACKIIVTVATLAML